MNDQLLSVEEFAERFGWKRRTVLENARRHSWPVIRIGRKIWFTETLYERILSQHTERAAPPASAPCCHRRDAPRRP